MVYKNKHTLIPDHNQQALATRLWGPSQIANSAWGAPQVDVPNLKNRH